MSTKPDDNAGRCPYNNGVDIPRYFCGQYCIYGRHPTARTLLYGRREVYHAFAKCNRRHRRAAVSDISRRGVFQIGDFHRHDKFSVVNKIPAQSVRQLLIQTRRLTSPLFRHIPARAARFYIHGPPDGRSRICISKTEFSILSQKTPSPQKGPRALHKLDGVRDLSTTATVIYNNDMNQPQPLKNMQPQPRGGRNPARDKRTAKKKDLFAEIHALAMSVGGFDDVDLPRYGSRRRPLFDD